jgi:hypothetical protein
MIKISQSLWLEMMLFFYLVEVTVFSAWQIPFLSGMQALGEIRTLFAAEVTFQFAVFLSASLWAAIPSLATGGKSFTNHFGCTALLAVSCIPNPI